MIARYTRPAMGACFSPHARFNFLLQVELAVAQAQSEAGVIPPQAFEVIKSRATFDLTRIDEIEKKTRHDVIAFVSNVAENIGPEGRFVHYGLTSSDVLDTALSLQVRTAGQMIRLEIDQLISVLRQRAEQFQDTLCAGRTHGMHAEPTSFGLKLAGHCQELVRNRQRFVQSLSQLNVGKLSGAVGTYSALPVEIEARALKILKLEPETIATQVIPRDRHAEVIFALTMIGAALERLAVELRHLQRTEVAEAFEGFGAGQKGSSAMPHKRNPISAENLTGCARLLRGYLGAAVEDIALWHERDISHSAVERVIFPDAFILADYALDRMTSLVAGLEVDADRMQHNMDLSAGKLMSSHLLLKLVEKGLSREDAYAKVQALSFQAKPEKTLEQLSLSDPELQQKLSQEEIRAVFSGQLHRAAIGRQLKRWLKERPI